MSNRIATIDDNGVNRRYDVEEDVIFMPEGTDPTDFSKTIKAMVETGTKIQYELKID